MRRHKLAQGSFHSNPVTETLDLARNEISGTIPTEYGEMLSIGKSKRAEKMDYQTIILSDIRHQEFINVRENPISGEVPSELGQLPFLETLAVGHTDLTGGMPAEICGMNIELKADCEEIPCKCCTVCCVDGGDCYANTQSPTQFPSRLPTPSPTTPFPTMAPVPGSTPLPTQEASQTPTMPPTKGPALYITLLGILSCSLWISSTQPFALQKISMF